MLPIEPVRHERAALPTVARALLVEDCERLRRAVGPVLAGFAREVLAAGTVAEAVRLLEEHRPELLLLDVSLPDGTALDVLAAARARSLHPTVVAMSGAGDPATAFELAGLGVRAYVPKPVTGERLRAVVARALTTAPNLTPHLRSAVGHVAIHEVEEQVREVMVEEALVRSSGNRRQAARALSISRQLLQHILRRAE